MEHRRKQGREAGVIDNGTPAAPLRFGRLLACGVVALPALALVVVPPVSSAARELSFEERVRAQEAIERVYYSHQIGATRSFEQAVPRALLEEKVRRYLEQTVALERYWRTPVTAEMLVREVERMARQSRMPGRLRQLFGSLGDDAFLVRECLARPALVDRLTRSFFAYDERIHAGAGEEARALREDLAAGRIDPRAEHPRRLVNEISRRDEGAPAGRERSRRDSPNSRGTRLDPEAFARRRARAPDRVGEVGTVVESREAFAFEVLLEEEAEEFEVAIYSVPKRSWDAWWASVRGGLDASGVRYRGLDRAGDGDLGRRGHQHRVFQHRG